MIVINLVKKKEDIASTNSKISCNRICISYASICDCDQSSQKRWRLALTNFKKSDVRLYEGRKSSLIKRQVRNGTGGGQSEGRQVCLPHHCHLYLERQWYFVGESIAIHWSVAYHAFIHHSLEPEGHQPSDQRWWECCWNYYK